MRIADKSAGSFHNSPSPSQRPAEWLAAQTTPSRATLVPGAAFHERLAASWSKGYTHGSFCRRRSFLMDRVESVLQSARTWLDAGCGSGVIARALADRGAAVIAVDASPAMLAQARRENAAPQIRYSLIDTVERLPLPDASVDGVVCSSVVEYVDEPNAALGELARVLRPGGVLVISVPNRLSVIRLCQQAARAAARFGNLSLFDYLSVSRHSWSRRGMRRALEREGFIVEESVLFSAFLPRLLVPLGLGALWFFVARRPETSPVA